MLSEILLIIVLAAVMYLFFLHVYVMRQLSSIQTEVENVTQYQRSNERQLKNLVQDINLNVARLQARIDGFIG